MRVEKKRKRSSIRGEDEDGKIEINRMNKIRSKKFEG